MVTYFHQWFFPFSPFLSDVRTDGTGELDHSNPLRLCCSFGSAAPQGGYSATVANRGPQAGTEDRHGREDEEDGRHAAVYCHRYQEEEDHTGAGMEQGYCRPNEQSQVLFIALQISHTFILYFHVMLMWTTCYNLVWVKWKHPRAFTKVHLCTFLLHTKILANHLYCLASSRQNVLKECFLTGARLQRHRIFTAHIEMDAMHTLAGRWARSILVIPCLKAFLKRVTAGISKLFWFQIYSLSLKHSLALYCWSCCWMFIACKIARENVPTCVVIKLLYLCMHVWNWVDSQ